MSGHSRPDIDFSVHQCARYNFFPEAIHERYLNRIGHYLKRTRSKLIILRPSRKFKTD